MLLLLLLLLFVSANRGDAHHVLEIQSPHGPSDSSPLLFETCQVPATELGLGLVPDPDDLNGRDQGHYRRVVV